MASSLNWSWRVLTRREHEGKGVPDGLSVGMGEGGNDIEVGREAEEAEAEKGEQVDLFWLVKVASNIKGTKSSVPVDSVQGLEHLHPTMITLW